MQPQTDPTEFPLDIYLFGKGSILVRGQPLPHLRSQSTGLILLARLILHAGSPLNRAWLAESIWPNLKDPDYNLRRNLSDLRQALGGEGKRIQTPQQGFVQFNLQDCRYDVSDFDKACAHGSSASRADLIQAITLYRGPLLEELSDESVDQERRVRQQAYMTALETLAATEAAEGQWSEAIRWLSRVVEVEPYQDSAHHALIVALASSGNPAAALRAYETFRERLGIEMNREPEPKTQALYQSLCEGKRVGPQSVDLSPLSYKPVTNGLMERHRRLFRIPRERNRYFTGREDKMKALDEALERCQFAAVTQAISGLGGMGKTSIAIEYAYRCLFETDVYGSPRYKAIQFIRADTVEILKAGYAEIAHALQLPRSDPNNLEQAVQAVIQWMTRPEEAPWLLILDNADDPTILKDFLPEAPQRHYGYVLITSRAHHFAHRIERVDLEQMNEEDGVKFLYERTKRQQIPGSKEEQAASTLVSEMGGLPLVLEQAAAYMTQGHAMSFEDCLAHFQDQQLRSKLIMQAPEYGFYGRLEPQTREYAETLTVLTTWRMSMAIIADDHPEAVELLRLCAFLHPVGIPRELVIALLPDYFASAGEDTVRQKVLYNDLLNALTRYSLIERNLENDTHSVHIVVQTVLRDEQQLEDLKREYERVLKAIAGSFPSEEKGERRALYYPHAERLRAYVDRNGIENEDVGWLLNHIGHYLKHLARFSEAEPLYKKALAMRRKALPTNQPDIAATLNALAVLYRLQNRFSEAELCYQEALAIRKNAFPKVHRDIAQTLNDLAVLYSDMECFDEAESLHLQALEIRREWLPGHRDVINSLINLGSLCNNQGHFEKAESYYLQALDCDSDGHPDASLINNLGKLYCDMGRFTKALPYILQAVDIWEKAFPKGHSTLAYGYNNLALSYQGLGRFDEAECLYRQAIEIREKAFPEGHPLTAKVLNNLARLYRSQGRFLDAERFFGRALAMRREKCPEGHSAIGVSLGDLAELSHYQGQYDEAAHLYQEALGLLWARLGSEHPDYLTVLTNYLCYLAQMEKEE